MASRKDESEPLLLGDQNSVNESTGVDSESDSNSNLYSKSKSPNKNEVKGTLISLQRVAGEYDFSITGENYDPLAERGNLGIENPTSNFETMIHLLKGNVGTGILAMPDAFRNSGWLVGTIGTAIIGIICVHTMQILVSCAHELSRRCKVPYLSFAQVAEAAFLQGPTPLRRFSFFAKTLINIFLVITQLGFCCVYFLFVAKNLSQVVNTYTSIDLSVHMYMLIILIPMILLSWIRNLKYLAPFSLIANIFMSAGLGIIFFYIFHDLPSVTARPAFASWKTLPLYFGTAIYAFEGIGMVLPLEKKMKTPADFGGCGGVLNTSMIIVGCLYTGLGFFGYLKYGSDIQGSITLNLPPVFLADIVRLMMALSIFLTYSLQFYVPIEITWPQIKERISSEKMQLIYEYIFRTLLVILTFAMAALIPDLGLFISLVGAVSSSTLALIFPPIISMLTNYTSGYGAYKCILLKDIFLIFFGITGFLAGTYTSVEQVINGISEK